MHLCQRGHFRTIWANLEVCTSDIPFKPHSTIEIVIKSEIQLEYTLKLLEAIFFPIDLFANSRPVGENWLPAKLNSIESVGLSYS